MPKAFPLQSVLEHRQRLEEQRKLDLARSEAELSQARTQVALAEAQHSALLVELARMKNAPAIDGYALLGAEQHLMHAKAKVEGLRTIEVIATEATEQARAAAVTAGQGRLAIERLRDTFQLTTRQQAEHAEAERLSEMGLARWQNHKRVS